MPFHDVFREKKLYNVKHNMAVANVNASVYRYKHTTIQTTDANTQEMQPKVYDW